MSVAEAPSARLNPDPKDRIEFHAEEFKALKTEIGELTKSTFSNLQYALLASGGLFGWLFTTLRAPSPGSVPSCLPPASDLATVAFLPMVISIVFGLLSAAAYMRVNTKGRYIARMEDQLAADDLGWERSLEAAPRLIFYVHCFAWTLLTASNLYFGLALYRWTRLAN